MTSAAISETAENQARPRTIMWWLLSVAGLVFIMVVVGGITRLTESGLSITEWDPVSGALPPLNQADWLEEFAKYQQTEQYQTVTGPAGMTLAQFKVIFFWEWVHRLLGRVIGLAFALPLLWFWMRGAIPKGYKLRLLALLALGGLQGAIGWWMVTSGLWTGDRVSHYRLAVHLLLALFILGGLVWTALDLHRLNRNPDAKPARLTGFGLGVAGVLFIQLLYGAWVAGMRAGYVANDWPLMQGRAFPAGVDWSQGLAAFANDPFLVHFIHRWWAVVAVIALVWLARTVRATNRQASIAIHSAFGTQFLLGVVTVFTGVNIVAATLHQAVGALVVVTTAWGVHIIGRRD